jgi:hypothetical protein
MSAKSPRAATGARCRRGRNRGQHNTQGSKPETSRKEARAITAKRDEARDEQKGRQRKKKKEAVQVKTIKLAAYLERNTTRGCSFFNQTGHNERNIAHSRIQTRHDLRELIVKSALSRKAEEQRPEFATVNTSICFLDPIRAR